MWTWNGPIRLHVRGNIHVWPEHDPISLTSPRILSDCLVHGVDESAEAGDFALLEEVMWRYWGKADPALEGHHSAVLHSLDVAACAWALVDADPVMRRKLGWSAGWREENVAASTAAFCSLHDVGKFDARFQVKAPEVAERLQPGLLQRIRASGYDHGPVGYQQVAHDSGAALSESLGADLSLLRAVCGHHGTIPGAGEIARDLPRAVERQDIQVRSEFVHAMVDLFRGLGAELPTTLSVAPVATQLMAGLCSVADWIGSQADRFTYASGPTDLEEYFKAALPRARDAVAAAGLRPAATGRATFADLFPGYQPRDVQTLTEQIAGDVPTLVLIEAEMGKGKTEAALAMSARLLSGGCASALYVALPTMATSNAMFSRVEAIAERMFDTSDGPVQLALAHSRAKRDPRFRRLVEKRLGAVDEHTPEATVMCARWLLGRKRTLLAQLGVGTVDQALHAVLRVRHGFVRLYALGRAVVLLDEVHAYDAYTGHLLERLVGWLGALDVPVLLLSATLPAERRSALVAAWRGESAPAASTFEAAVATPYPWVTEATKDRVQCLGLADHESGRRVEIVRTSADAASIVPDLERLAAGGARVVWIRNTVREAQQAFREVGTGVESHLFHARFRAKDRAGIENRVLDRFGKAAPPGGRLLIATQVVEQSLDLDFDALYSDLAPADLLLQRCGRLHRHTRARPVGCEAARMIVVVPSAEDAAALRFGPSMYVYDAPTLWLTLREVEARDAWLLPGHIRPLVEAIYHPEARARSLAVGGVALEDAERKRHEKRTSRETLARQVSIPSATVERSAGGTVDDDDDSVQALTRDGKSATVLPIAWDGEAATSLDGEVWDLDPFAPQAWRTADRLLEETVSFSTHCRITSVHARGEAHAWEDFRRRFEKFAGAWGQRHITPIPLSRSGLVKGDPLWRGSFVQGRSRRAVAYSHGLGLMFPRAERAQNEEESGQ